MTGQHIVQGIDGSRRSLLALDRALAEAPSRRLPVQVLHAALSFAFDEASRRGYKLVALHAWPHPTSAGPGDEIPFVYDIDMAAEGETSLLAEADPAAAVLLPAMQRQARRHGVRLHLAALSESITSSLRELHREERLRIYPTVAAAALAAAAK